VVPTLAFVLTMSAALHMTRYALYLEPALKTDSPPIRKKPDRSWGGLFAGDQRRLLRISWLPCTISTLTTIIGVLTLLASNYPAVREFAAFAAGSLVFSLVIQLGLLPWLLTRFGRMGLRNLATRDQAGRVWKQLPGGIERLKYPIVAVSALIVAITMSGMFRLKPDVEAENLFRADSEMLVSIGRLERQIGPMDQTEALLVFENPDKADFHRRVTFVRQMSTMFARIPEVDLAYSLTDYLPAEPRGTGVLATGRKRIYRQFLEEKREGLAESEMLNADGDNEIWRISLKFAFSTSSDFRKLEEHVREIDRRMNESAARQWTGFRTPKLVYTGTTHLVHSAQESLLGDFAISFGMAFLMITPVLMIVLRSFWLGVIGMVGNLIPAIIVFGWMGWAGVSIDIALGMTASIALGIAVDDTTHLMIRFREQGGRVASVRAALQRSLQQCGPAMLHTTLIACAGMFTFWFSELPVISRFAAAISAMLFIAMLADLFVLPALLLCTERLWTVFRGQKQPDSPTSTN